MQDHLLYYNIGAGVEAFSTMVGAVLPYPVLQMHQVHGDRIAVITDRQTTREDLRGYDAMITDIPGLAIGARSADCIPVLLFDPVHQAIAAIHSGWRGTVQRISQKTILQKTQRYVKFWFYFPFLTLILGCIPILNASLSSVFPRR